MRRHNKGPAASNGGGDMDDFAENLLGEEERDSMVRNESSATLSGGSGGAPKRSVVSTFARGLYYGVLDLFPVSIVPVAKLLPAEQRRLEPFKVHASVKFNPSNEYHSTILIELWRIFANPTEEFIRTGERWKDFGFQNVDPVSDFRGGGLFCVTNMLYIHSTHPALWHRILNPKLTAKQSSYPVAIAGINITMTLLNILPLEFEKATCFSRTHAATNASSSDARTNFARLLLRGDGVIDMSRIFGDVYCLAFRILDALWYEGDCNLLNFNAVLLSCKKRMDVILRDAETVACIQAQLMDE